MSRVANYRLLENADYSDFNIMRGLIKNMGALKKQAGTGDMVALSIYIDLKEAIYSGNSELSSKQRQAVHLNLVHGIPQEDVGEIMGLTQRTVNHHVRKGIDGVINFLMQEVEE